MKKEKISIIVPCYNEEESLPIFYKEINKISKEMKEVNFEFLFVNDGSKDKTLSILRDLSKKDDRVRFISFSRNFGKEGGMYAGLENATGDYVAIMDADMQDPPSMIDDCLKEGKSVQEGGAVYNFTGPQGFGIANMADGLFAIRKLVYEDKKVSMKELKEALAWNYDKGLDAQSAGDMTEMIMKAMQKAGRNVDASTAEGLLKTFMGMKPGEQKTQRFKEIHDMIDEVPKFGNDIPEVDYFAREVAYTYSKPLQKYNNPRGGKFQAGLYPVSANVPLGGQTGATPDGRYAHTPVADGVSPSAGKDVKGPTAAATSVSRLDHFIVSNGTLFNQKFHPSALSGREGLEKFVALIRGYFDQKGMHMQFNVVDRQTLLDAQEHPEKYKHLVVRVAGYSALFTTLSRSLQDDIIRRTEQGF